MKFVGGLDPNAIEVLIQDYQRTDPRLYDILTGITNQLEVVAKTLDEVTNPEILPPIVDPTIPLPATITYTLPGDSVKLEWAGVDSIGVALSSIALFEIRKGAVWNTASLVVKTSSLSALLPPNLLTGNHTYLLKTINSAGNYSVDFLTVIVTIAEISTVSLTSVVVDNNILLYWTLPVLHSFNIVKYEVFREGVSIGFKTGTFLATFESVGGVYNYGVRAYDLAGNTSFLVGVNITVASPPDFELVDIINSTFTGTKTKCIASSGQLIAQVNLTKTFEDHFIDNSWTTIQDQITAGFPLYLQPTETTATYVEVFDFGLIISGALVNIGWASQQFDLTKLVAITCSIEASDAGAVYGTPVSGISAYFTSCRYVRVTLTFTPTDTHSLVAITNLSCSIDIKYGIDSGNATADKTDAAGTAVLFNRVFKDVSSITLTTDSMEPITAIYDFTDAPYPTGFLIFTLDSSGRRITYPVSWKARGII